MKSYYGFDKPYIYLCYSENDDVTDIFGLLEKNNITCCLSNDQWTRKESRHIEAAFGVVLLMSKNLLKEKKTREIISAAVSFNKNILCIYLEELKLDACLTMQLNTQQAIFKFNNNNFEDVLKKAAVFKDMKITRAQIDFQRRRTLSLVTAVGTAAVLIFAIVVYPLMQEQEIRSNGVAIDLGDLTEEDLLEIENFSVLGENGYDATEYSDFCATYANNSKERFNYRYVVNDRNFYGDEMIDIGNISDISVVEKMKNAKVLILVGQNISDITPILELENLEVLVLDCNPISDISGISKLKNLKILSLNGTYIKDLSETFTISSLETLNVSQCSYVTSLKGIENTNIIHIDASECSITQIDDLGYRDYGSVSVHANYISDLSFITTTRSIDNLCVACYNVNTALEKVKEANVQRLALNDVRIPVSLSDINMPGLKNLTINGNYNALTSIEGIDTYFPVLEYFESVSLSSRDFTPLLNCKNLGNFLTSTDYEEEVYEQLVGEANFRIYLRDDTTHCVKEVTQ